MTRRLLGILVLLATCRRDPRRAGDPGQKRVAVAAPAGSLVGKQPVMLVSDAGRDGSTLAVDGDSVYWISHHISFAGVNAAPKAGGPARVVVDLGDELMLAPRALAVSRTSVFFATLRGGIMWAPSRGGRASDFLETGAVRLLVANDEVLFWVEPGSAHEVPLPLPPPAEVHALVPEVGALAAADVLALDQDRLYWLTAPTADAPADAIWMVPLAGGTPTQVASGPFEPGAMAVHDGRVYAARTLPAGQLVEIAAGREGVVTTLAGRAQSLVADDSGLYAFEATPDQGHRIVRISR